MRGWYQFKFKNRDEYEDGRLTFHLASFSTEGIYGEVRVRLESNTLIDSERLSIAIDGSNEIGEMLIKIFTRLLSREFGESGFGVTKLATKPALPKAQAQSA